MLDHTVTQLHALQATPPAGAPAAPAAASASQDGASAAMGPTRMLEQRVRDQQSALAAAEARVATLERFVKVEKGAIVQQASARLAEQSQKREARWLEFARRARACEASLRKELGAAAESAQRLAQQLAVYQEPELGEDELGDDSDAEAMAAPVRPVRTAAMVEMERLQGELEGREEEILRQQRRVATVMRDGHRRCTLLAAVLAFEQQRLASADARVHNAERVERASTARAKIAEDQVSRMKFESKAGTEELRQVMRDELSHGEERIWSLKDKLNDRAEELRATRSELQQLCKACAELTLGRESQPSLNLHDRVRQQVDAMSTEASELQSGKICAIEERHAGAAAVLEQQLAAVGERLRLEISTNAAEVGELQAESRWVREELTEQLAAVCGELSGTSDKLAASHRACDRAEAGLAAFRLIEHRLVQYIADKRQILSSQSDGYDKKEIGSYARYLGVDADADRHLLWIAEEALGAPIPQHWTSHRDRSGEFYYYCSRLDKSTYEHPMDKCNRSRPCVIRAVPAVLFGSPCSDRAAVMYRLPRSLRRAERAVQPRESLSRLRRHHLPVRARKKGRLRVACRAGTARSWTAKGED